MRGFACSELSLVALYFGYLPSVLFQLPHFLLYVRLLLLNIAAPGLLLLFDPLLLLLPFLLLSLLVLLPLPSLFLAAAQLIHLLNIHFIHIVA